LKDFTELLFESSNAAALSEKIALFYQKSEEERQAIGQELRKYCIEHFSVERFIKAHEELYSTLIKRRS
jgi:glycosyltransferase involved in cell wall biosynthesis